LKIIFVAVFVTAEVVFSNIDGRRRRWDRWLAWISSGDPFAAEERRMLPSATIANDFRAQARPQPSAQPALSDLVLGSSVVNRRQRRGIAY
jgi:hypothetical protein